MCPTSALIPKALVARAVRAVGHRYRLEPKDVTAAVDTCRQLARFGVGSTIGWFSGVLDDPEDVVRDYLWASNALRDEAGDRFYLSVKAPAIDFDVDAASRIALTASANQHGIHFDSHGIRLADPTLTLIDRLLSRGPGLSDAHGGAIGISIASRWKRSSIDADWAIERQVRVRLVKGEFPAGRPAEVADPSNAALRLIDRLAGRVPVLTIGTHDQQLARDALCRLRGAGAATRLELLYGFPTTGLIALARELNVQVGFYVPYGDALLVYGIRHLLANPHKLARGNYLAALRRPERRLNDVSRQLGIA